jgi:hypothetical protein
VLWYLPVLICLWLPPHLSAAFQSLSSGISWLLAHEVQEKLGVNLAVEE